MTSRRWLIRVFFAYFVFAALVLAWMAWVTHKVKAPDFLISLRDPMIAVQEKPFLMHNVSCEVLVFGDSTALTGVDARVIAADTGLTACNIAVTWPVISMLDTMPLDDFLAHNPRPKYIVLQFDPLAFYDRSNVELNFGLAGPFATMIRQRSRLQAAWFIAKNLSLGMNFYWTAFLSSVHPHPDQTAAFHRVYDGRLKDFMDNGGPLTIQSPTLTRCGNLFQFPSIPPDAKWIASMRTRYQKSGTVVLIKGSPVPVCETRFPRLEGELGPVLDENVEALPKEDFVLGGRHMTLKGAQDESHHLAQHIVAREQASTAPNPK